MSNRILHIKEIVCSICGGIYEAKQQDSDSRCPSCRSIYLREWRKLSKSREAKAKAHRLMRERAFAGYGNKCACCGENRFEFLAIDHVNGGGHEDRKTHNTWQIAKRVIELNFPKEYRVLCHNCNLSIGWYGYCPHEKRKRTA